MLRSAFAITRVVVVARLFELSLSAVSLETPALLVITDPAGRLGSTRVTIVMVRTAPSARTPNAQDVGTLPGIPALQLAPPLPLTDTTLSVAGSRSLTTTLFAADGPLLVTVIVNVRFVPATTGSGLSVFVIERSAAPRKTRLPVA